MIVKYLNLQNIYNIKLIKIERISIKKSYKKPKLIIKIDIGFYQFHVVEFLDFL